MIGSQLRLLGNEDARPILIRLGIGRYEVGIYSASALLPRSARQHASPHAPIQRTLSPRDTLPETPSPQHMSTRQVIPLRRNTRILRMSAPPLPRHPSTTHHQETPLDGRREATNVGCQTACVSLTRT